MKPIHKNNILAVILSAVTLVTSISIMYDTYAKDSLTSANTGVDNYNKESKSVVLGNPFYVEHYKDIVVKPEISNESSIGTFTGKGLLNGTMNINAEGNSTETLRNNETVFIQGNARFVNDNGDVAEYSFEAIGNYNSDGTFEGTGAAVFDGGATGELSSLSNTVAIYKDRTDSSGNGTFLMWYWN